MPIDPSIALGYQPIKMENPITNVLAAQNVGVNALKMQEMQRGIQEENALRDLIKGGADINSPETLRKMYEISPKQGIAFEKSRGELTKLKGESQKLITENAQKATELYREQLPSVNTPQDMASFITAQYNDPRIGAHLNQVRPLDQAIAAIPQDPAGFNKYKNQMAMGMKDFITHTTVSANTAATVGATLRGQNMQYDPTLQGNIVAAKAGGTEYGKAGAQANIALPGAIATGEEAIRKVDELVGKAPVVNAEGKVVTPGTKPAAGFSQAVGLGIPGLKYIPGSSVSDFNARLNEIQGGAFLQAFNTLKGGGSITETEGTKATQAINRMSTAQSEKEFNIAAREYQDILRTGIGRAKAKAATLSGGGIPVGRGGAAPATGGEIDFNSLK